MKTSFEYTSAKREIHSARSSVNAAGVALVHFILSSDTFWKMTFESSQNLLKQDPNYILRLLLFMCVTEKEIQNTELRSLFELIEDHRPALSAKFPDGWERNTG